jgi:hypothetical protein
MQSPLAFGSLLAAASPAFRLGLRWHPQFIRAWRQRKRRRANCRACGIVPIFIVPEIHPDGSTIMVDLFVLHSAFIIPHFSVAFIILHFLTTPPSPAQRV